MSDYAYDPDDVGKRVIYVDRSGKETQGTIRGGHAVAKMVDVKLDGKHSQREVFYVPQDTLTLIPDELQETLGSAAT